MLNVQRTVLFFLLLSSTALLPTALLAATLSGVRAHEDQQRTRIVLDLSGPVQHELLVLKRPHRVILDLPTAELGADFETAAVAGLKRLRGLRAGRRGAGYRLVFDVSGAMQPKAFSLPPGKPHGHRLVLDLLGALPATAVAAKPAPQAKPERERRSRRASEKTERAQQPATVTRLPAARRDVLVAIDPGHGGNDPGALGPGRIREKDVVLAISKQLLELIKAQRGFDAVLIRDDDFYVALGERVRVARAKRADLFVSVHADAFHNAKVTGASVYTLSQSGASSEAARWLAAKENKSDLIGGAGRVTLNDKDDLLAEVLLDMSTIATRSMSRRAGAAVLKELGGFARLHRDTVEQAGFIVLKAPDVPSILVETGYISNPAEARRLASKSYQSKVAKAIARGVTAYMTESAPPGTWLASGGQASARSHTIRRGETLSGLAQRYGIAARRIREANALRGDRIRVGQTLIIPAG